MENERNTQQAQQERASILEMARGAIMEQVDGEISKIVDNIIDPNTEAKKKRQLILTIDFVPSADRTVVGVSASAKCKLQAANSIQTSLYVGVDSRTGEVIATEMTPNITGQINFDGDEESEPPVLRMA